MANKIAGLVNQYDEDGIWEVANDLKAAAVVRNTRMNRADRIYRMQVYESEPQPGAAQVVMPTATDMVDKMTATLNAMPPVIGVRVAGEQDGRKGRAQVEEEFLYGLAYAMNLNMHRQMATHNALRLGEGWIKLVCDIEQTAEGESPVKALTPDPRRVYYTPSTTEDKPQCLVEWWKRTRGEIEDELGIELTGHPSDSTKLAEWLKGKVDYVEFWEERSVLEDEPPENSKKDKVEDKAEGEVEGMYGGVTPDPMAALVESGEQMGEATSSAEADAEDEAQTGVKKKKKRKCKKLVVVHAKLVGDNEVKSVGKRLSNWYFVKNGDPKVYPGLDRVPYFVHYGRPVIEEGQRRGVPLLYSVTGGDAGTMGLGVLQARNRLISLGVEIAQAMGGRVPYITNDPGLTTVNTNAGAVNYVQGDLKPLWPEQNVQMAMSLFENLGRQVYESGIPQVYNGESHNMSGAAIEGLGSVFKWTLSAMQEQQSRQLEALLRTGLRLAKEYADVDEGWEVSGRNQYGENVSATIKPDDIDVNDRVEVRLSSALPSDKYAHLNMLNQIKAQRGITQEQFIDEAQKLLGNSDRSPKATLQTVIGETLFWNLMPELAKGLGQSDVAKVMVQGLTDKLGSYAMQLMPDEMLKAQVKTMMAQAQMQAQQVQGMYAPQEAMAQPQAAMSEEAVSREPTGGEPVSEVLNMFGE